MFRRTFQKGHWRPVQHYFDRFDSFFSTRNSIVRGLMRRCGVNIDFRPDHTRQYCVVLDTNGRKSTWKRAHGRTIKTIPNVSSTGRHSTGVIRRCGYLNSIRINGHKICRAIRETWFLFFGDQFERTGKTKTATVGTNANRARGTCVIRVVGGRHVDNWNGQKRVPLKTRLRNAAAVRDDEWSAEWIASATRVRSSLVFASVFLCSISSTNPRRDKKRPRQPYRTTNPCTGLCRRTLQKCRQEERRPPSERRQTDCVRDLKQIHYFHELFLSVREVKRGGFSTGLTTIRHCCHRVIIVLVVRCRS